MHAGATTFSLHIKTNCTANTVGISVIPDMRFASCSMAGPVGKGCMQRAGMKLLNSCLPDDADQTGMG